MRILIIIQFRLRYFQKITVFSSISDYSFILRLHQTHSYTHIFHFKIFRFFFLYRIFQKRKLSVCLFRSELFYLYNIIFEFFSFILIVNTTHKSMIQSHVFTYRYIYSVSSENRPLFWEMKLSMTSIDWIKKMKFRLAQLTKCRNC